jgi:hypothetical protein
MDGYISAAMIFALSLSTNAAAQSSFPVNTAKGEMLLEISATGISKQKAIKISSSCTITTEAETDAKSKQMLDELIAKIKSSGSSSVSFDFSQPPETIFYASDSFAATAAVEAATDAAATAGDAAVEASDTQKHSKRSKKPVVIESVTEDTEEPIPNMYGYKQKVVFSGIDADTFLRARNITQETSCDEEYSSSRFLKIEIADPKGAGNLAMQAAIADAKAQAQEYAALMGMNVVALARVSTSSEIRAFLGEQFSTDLLREMRRDLFRRGETDPKSIENVDVEKNIKAEFILKAK